MKITTDNHSYSPDSRFTWTVYETNEVEDGEYGYGATEAEAIIDYLSQYLRDEQALEIVHAVNNHAPLLKALESCINWHEANHSTEFRALKAIYEEAK